MSRVPDESRSWPTEADGEAALADLRRQIENARYRLGHQWSLMRDTEAAAEASDPGGDEARA